MSKLSRWTGPRKPIPAPVTGAPATPRHNLQAGLSDALKMVAIQSLSRSGKLAGLYSFNKKTPFSV